MTREIDSAVATASTQDVVRPVLLVRLGFDSGMVRVHSGVGNIAWNSENWTGIGDYGGISAIRETGDLEANGITLTLSGVASDYLSIALGENYQGRDATVYLGLLDSSLSLIDNPVVLFAGKIDAQSIALGETATIALTAENPLAAWQRPNVRRYNNEDQQSRYPGDKGCEFVEQTVEKEVQWGPLPDTRTHRGR